MYSRTSHERSTPNSVPNEHELSLKIAHLHCTLFHEYNKKYISEAWTSMGSSAVASLFCVNKDLAIPCVEFARPVVVLWASFPHPEVWGTIRSLNVKHKVLYKRHLIGREDNLQNKRTVIIMALSHCPRPRQRPRNWVQDAMASVSV